jgi:peptide/nickel transport system permease protein
VNALDPAAAVTAGGDFASPAAVPTGSLTLPRRRGRLRGASTVLALHLLSALAVVTVAFALPRAMPGDPLVALQDRSITTPMTPEVRTRQLEYYSLDRPLVDQYRHYLSGLARGDLGWSISRNAAVASLVAAHLPWTLLLLGTSFAVAGGVSFVAGVAAAWRRGRRLDRGLLVATTGLRALPPYVLASLLVVGLAVLVPVFPLAGARTPFATDASPFGVVEDVALHLALPATALSLSLLGTRLLLVRNSMVSCLGQDYMVLARAKGLPPRLLKYRHGGRNALLPFIAAMGVEAGFAAGFAIFVESVFAYPGMGTLILRGVEARDYPVLEAGFLVLAAVVLACNLATDLVSARLDPRVAAQ